MWASENEILMGYEDGTFRPNVNVTREQMCTFLYRYAQYRSFDVTGGKSIKNAKDYNHVSGYAEKALEWAYGNGIISGTSKDSFTISPKNPASRTNIAAIFHRFMDEYMEIKEEVETEETVEETKDESEPEPITESKDETVEDETQKQTEKKPETTEMPETKEQSETAKQTKPETPSETQKAPETIPEPVPVKSENYSNLAVNIEDSTGVATFIKILPHQKSGSAIPTFTGTYKGVSESAGSGSSISVSGNWDGSYASFVLYGDGGKQLGLCSDYHTALYLGSLESNTWYPVESGKKYYYSLDDDGKGTLSLNIKYSETDISNTSAGSKKIQFVLLNGLDFSFCRLEIKPNKGDPQFTGTKYTLDFNHTSATVKYDSAYSANYMDMKVFDTSDKERTDIKIKTVANKAGTSIAIKWYTNTVPVFVHPDDETQPPVTETQAAPATAPKETEKETAAPKPTGDATLTSPADGAVLNLHTTAQDAFLDANRASMSLSTFQSYKQKGPKPNPVTFSWTTTLSQSTLQIAENSTFSKGVIVKKVNGKSATVYNLKTGTKYYWRVNGSAARTFTTKEGIRFLSIDGIKNTRDIGGQKTSFGKRVKQSMIFRGTNWDGSSYGATITDSGIDYLVNIEGLKTELNVATSNGSWLSSYRLGSVLSSAVAPTPHTANPSAVLLLPVMLP